MQKQYQIQIKSMGDWYNLISNSWKKQFYIIRKPYDFMNYHIHFEDIEDVKICNII
jgi:hypothetical protein